MRAYWLVFLTTLRFRPLNKFLRCRCTFPSIEVEERLILTSRPRKQRKNLGEYLGSRGLNKLSQLEVLAQHVVYFHCAAISSVSLRSLIKLSMIYERNRYTRCRVVLIDYPAPRNTANVPTTIMIVDISSSFHSHILYCWGIFIPLMWDFFLPRLRLSSASMSSGESDNDQ